MPKHLAYLRTNGVVTAQRHEKWMIYQLPKEAPPELDLQRRCLQDCVQSNPIFRDDLKRLKKIRCECEWVEEAAQSPRK